MDVHGPLYPFSIILQKTIIGAEPIYVSMYRCIPRFSINILFLSIGGSGNMGKRELHKPKICIHAELKLEHYAKWPLSLWVKCDFEGERYLYY